MKELSHFRFRMIDSLKHDRLLADADWKRVEVETRVELPFSISEEEVGRHRLLSVDPYIVNFVFLCTEIRRVGLLRIASGIRTATIAVLRWRFGRASARKAR